MGAQEQEVYDQAGIPIFGPKGGQMAYGAVTGNSKFMVVDGQKQNSYDIIGTPVFSPEGGHLAYVAGMGDTRFVVIDGKNGGAYDFIFNSSQGGIYFDSANSFHYLAVRGDKIYLVEEKLQ